MGKILAVCYQLSLSPPGLEAWVEIHFLFQVKVFHDSQAQTSTLVSYLKIEEYLRGYLRIQSAFLYSMRFQ